jgi:hypothetical protein
MVDRRQRTGLQLLRGIFSFFHRDRPGEIDVEAGGVNATIRGTEFVFSLGEQGVVAIALFDGTLEVSNSTVILTLHSGEVATVRPGEAPRKTAMLASGDFSAIQWALYYPAILYLEDIRWPHVPEIDQSIMHYRAGHLPLALASYPSGRQPSTAGEHLYLACRSGMSPKLNVTWMRPLRQRICSHLLPLIANSSPL